MKAKVIREFIDKETHKLHKVGDEFVCNRKRFDEIVSAGDFVESIEDTKEKK